MADMPNIDWDGVAQEADNSPRGVLAEFMADADEYHCVIVAGVKIKGTEDGNDWTAWRVSGSTIIALGLVTALQSELNERARGV